MNDKDMAFNDQECTFGPIFPPQVFFWGPEVSFLLFKGFAAKATISVFVVCVIVYKRGAKRRVACVVVNNLLVEIGIQMAFRFYYPIWIIFKWLSWRNYNNFIAYVL